MFDKPNVNSFNFRVLGAHFQVGAKTVIPGKVIGKFSIRIVPNQEPEEVEKLVFDYVNKKVSFYINIHLSLCFVQDKEIRDLPCTKYTPIQNTLFENYIYKILLYGLVFEATMATICKTSRQTSYSLRLSIIASL